MNVTFHIEYWVAYQQNTGLLHYEKLLMSLEVKIHIQLKINNYGDFTLSGVVWFG